MDGSKSDPGTSLSVPHLYHCGIPDPDRGTEISQRQYGLPSFIPGSRIRDPVFCELPGGGPDRKDDPGPVSYTHLYKSLSIP